MGRVKEIHNLQRDSLDPGHFLLTDNPIWAVNGDWVRVRYFWRPLPWRVFPLPLFLVAMSESSFFQRFVGLFSSKDEPEIQFKTNDIEMATFSVVIGQSPDVLVPSLCCSAAGRTPNGRGWFVNCDLVKDFGQEIVRNKCLITMSNGPIKIRSKYQ